MVHSIQHFNVDLSDKNHGWIYGNLVATSDNKSNFRQDINIL